uniref:CSON007213 protein n=1 Tax=Culicoides sonorensis TaxID=179676 RepID=A0A336M2P9_CULSO
MYCDVITHRNLSNIQTKHVFEHYNFYSERDFKPNLIFVCCSVGFCSSHDSNVEIYLKFFFKNRYELDCNSKSTLI